MSNYNDKESMLNRLYAYQDFSFSSPEEYYFLLGQCLVYVFTQLGGVHKYKKEFNYLTNPYLPQDVHQLGIRILRFLSKLPASFLNDNPVVSHIIRSLINKKQQYCDIHVNPSTCSDALFEGLHSDNIIHQLSNQKTQD